MGDRGDLVIGMPFDDLAVRTFMGETTAEGNVVGDARPAKLPGVSLHQPVVGALDLPAILDSLLKHAGIIADAVAIGRITERGERIHEAGGETAEPAIAERGVLLLLIDLLEIHAKGLQCIAAKIVEFEIVEVIAERATDQELHREVVDRLDVLLVLHRLAVEPAVGHASAREIGHGLKPVVRARIFGMLANDLHEGRADIPRYTGDVRCLLVCALGASVVAVKSSHATTLHTQPFPESHCPPGRSGKQTPDSILHHLTMSSGLI